MLQVLGWSRSLGRTVVSVFQPRPVFSDSYFTPFVKTPTKYSLRIWWSAFRIETVWPSMSVMASPSRAAENFSGSAEPALFMAACRNSQMVRKPRSEERRVGEGGEGG